MKTEEEVKKAMENVRLQLTESDNDQTIFLQGQHSALKYVLDEEKKDEE